MSVPLCYRYWGKAQPEQGTSPYHLLPYHCFDVVAVAQTLWARRPLLRRALCDGLGLDDLHGRDLVCWLIGLHDLGKFADCFQRLAPDVYAGLNPGTSAGTNPRVRHDVLGYALWRDVLHPSLIEDGRLSADPDAGTALQILMHAVTGHHGNPLDPQGPHRFVTAFTPADRAAAHAWTAILLEHFPHAVAAANRLREKGARRVSLLLAGFCMIADWVGSYQSAFAYVSDPYAWGDYPATARAAAENLLTDIGLAPVPAAPARGLSGLFPGYRPMPMQAAADSLSLPAGPQLIFLEDLTGSGKTEAAMVLTQRLIADGAADGVYIGLPTTATADQMYDRVAACYARFYRAGRPSLVLAHGHRRRHLGFRASIGLEDAEDPFPAHETPSGAQCAAWLADRNKKALLAHVGVGTVDQCMTAALQVKHAPLRLYGLLGKVLVIDELHAYDAYMQAVLQRLVTLHTRQGGSTLLLSATLPRAVRAAFVQTFAQAVGASLPAPTATAYPLLTHVHADTGLRETAVPAAASRDVSVALLHEDPLPRIKTWLAAGRCVCWIRNSVDDAVATWEACRAFVPPDRLHLFHARFMLGDRLRIQGDVLQAFGKTGTAALRRGRLVIATQVVEQSLDVDFDELITDLAPIDLLLQRLGRLKRHTRTAEGDPCPTPDARGPRVLHVYGPPLEPEPDPKAWLTSYAPSGRYVYQDRLHLLWLTLHRLSTHPTFSLPRDARTLVEAVYDTEIGGPDSLLSTELKQEAARYVQEAQALQRCWDADVGYAPGTLPAHAPTRYHIQRRALRLAAITPAGAHPLFHHGDDPWSDSVVAVPERWWASKPEFSSEDTEALKPVAATLPDKGQDPRLVPMRADGTLYHAYDRSGRVVLTYDPLRGARKPHIP